MAQKLNTKDYADLVRSIQERTRLGVNETADTVKQRIPFWKKDYNLFCHELFPHYCQDGEHEHARLIGCGWFQIEFANAILKDDNYFGANEWPREHAKTVHAGVIIPFWLMIHGKLDGMIVAGREERSAQRILMDIQAEFEGNQKIKAVFGEQKSIGSWDTGDFRLKSGIFFRAFGLGQNPRGVRYRQRRPNYGLVSDIDDDEMVLNQKRVKQAVKWILGSFYGCLNIKRKRFVIEGNRIHKQSILAHIIGDITPETPKRKNLKHIKVVAYDKNGIPAWKERFTKEELDRQIDAMGSILGRREYFHEPTIEGTVFKDSWINWGKCPAASEMDAIVEYCDPSDKGNATSCYKSIVRVGKKGKYIYILKVYCRQETNTHMWQWWYDNYEPRIGAYLFMEAIFGQDRYLEDCDEEGERRGWVLPVTPDMDAKADKLTRIIATLQAIMQRGLVIWNEAEQGSNDMQELRSQLLAIEQGSNHFIDGPDALQGGVEKLNGLARVGTGYERRAGKLEHQGEY